MEPARDTHPRTTTSFAPREERWVDSTIPLRFLEQVEASGSRPAVIGDDGALTYAELGAQVSAIAAALLAAGVQPGSVVALLADTSAEAVAAILGILHAGAAFAPLDVLDPPSRAASLVDLAGATHLVASSSRREEAAAIAAATGRPVRVVDLALIRADTPSPARPVAITPLAPASVFFTSGSTGAPKAVLDVHRNVLHNTFRYTTLLEVTGSDRLSLVQRLSFSGIASSLFTAVLNGATLCTFPLSADTLTSLAGWARCERVTIFHSVPAIFRALVAGGGAFPDVRVVRLEGDRASWRDVEVFRQHFSDDAILANGLGTTETGLVCQLRVGRETPLGSGVLPVGWPAPGMDVLVLGADGHTLPNGEVGELGVRSTYLAAGYLGDDELTAARFGADPDGGERRVYRTGDLGRLDAAGCVEYLGRVDGSFKVGGVRVEPAEVESALLRVPGLVDAAVTVEPGRREAGRLVASVVTHEPRLDAADVRHELAAIVPAYMIPTRIDVVDTLAVGAHWKLERTARNGQAESDDPLERQLQGIWESVLELDSVGTDESFFDLGGDSLGAAEIVAAAEVEAGRPLGVGALVEAPTIELLARLIRSPTSSGSAVTRLSNGDANQPPFFVAHDLTGDLLVYSALASSLPWRVLGLRQLDASEVGFRDYAGQLGHVIREHQPHGPYRLGGHCFGAVLAFEIAQQLLGSGEQIELLALLGVTAWDFPRLAPELWQTHLAELGVEPAPARARRHVGRALALGLRGSTRHLLGAVRSAPAYLRLRRGTHPARLEHDEVSQRNTDAFRSYRPRRFPGEAFVIVAANDTRGLAPERALRGLADHTTIHVVGEQNAEMLAPPYVGETARLLRNVVAAQTVP